MNSAYAAIQRSIWDGVTEDTEINKPGFELSFVCLEFNSIITFSS